MEWVIVGLLTLLNVIVPVWMSLRLYALIQNGLDNLDGNIAAAIKTLIERGIGEMEPINPVQAAIAQFITTRMSENPNPVKVELPRAIDGKFSER